MKPFTMRLQRKVLDMTEPRKCCKDCEKRSASCHCTCEEYKAYKKELDEYNEIVRKKKEEEYRMNSYNRDNYSKRRWTK